MKDLYLQCADLSKKVYDEPEPLELLTTFQARTRLIDAQARIYEQKGRLVVAFRGTEPDKIADIITDMRFFPRPIYSWKYPWYLGRIHSGFYDSTNLILHAENTDLGIVLLDRIKRAQRDNKHVVFTGHSLGGSMAAVAGFLAPGVEVVTFGAAQWGKLRIEYPSECINFINNMDPVPRFDIHDFYDFVGRREYLGAQRRDIQIISEGIQALKGIVHTSQDHFIDSYIKALKEWAS